jgi:uncharacterized protein YigE (DUF2233 family)
LIFPLLALTAACSAGAVERVSRGERILEASEGELALVVYRAKAGKRPLYLVEATLGAGADIRVEPSAGPARLEDILAKAPEGFAAVNGGFYDKQGIPMGLVVSDGKTRSKLKRGGGSGVFLVDAKGPRVVHRDEVPKQRIAQAVQSIDRVVDGGKALVGPRASAALDARSAVSVDKDGRVRLLAIFSPDAVAQKSCGPSACTFALDSRSSSSGVSLAELARYLVDTGSREALNLDGGYSTSFEAALGGKRLRVRAFGATVQALVARP